MTYFGTDAYREYQIANPPDHLRPIYDAMRALLPDAPFELQEEYLLYNREQFLTKYGRPRLITEFGQYAYDWHIEARDRIHQRNQMRNQLQVALSTQEAELSGDEVN